MIGIKSIAIALSVITFCLCACQGQRGNGQVDGNVSDTVDYGEVNDSLVMKYISCPKSIVWHTSWQRRFNLFACEWV